MSKSDIFSLIKTNNETEPSLDCCADQEIIETSSKEPPLPNHHPFKIVAELRPQDAYFLQKTRGATVVPTYSIKGEKNRIIGSPLSISVESSEEYQRALHSSQVTSAFPEGSTDRALEVIY